MGEHVFGGCSTGEERVGGLKAKRDPDQHSLASRSLTRLVRTNQANLIQLIRNRIEHTMSIRRDLPSSAEAQTKHKQDKGRKPSPHIDPARGLRTHH